MDELVAVSFQMISQMGASRSKFIEAYKLMKKKEFERAHLKIKEGEEAYIKGHTAHVGLIQKEANGEKIYPTLLLMHAEDQLMSTETTKLMALELVELYETLYELSDKVKRLEERI